MWPEVNQGLVCDLVRAVFHTLAPFSPGLLASWQTQEPSLGEESFAKCFSEQTVHTWRSLKDERSELERSNSDELNRSNHLFQPEEYMSIAVSSVSF